MKLTKRQAIAVFGRSGAELARAVGLSRGRISQWNDELSQKQVDLVIGAAVRLGRVLPEEATGTSEDAKNNHPLLSHARATWCSAVESTPATHGGPDTSSPAEAPT